MGWPVSSLKYPRLWGLKSPPASPRQPSRLEILPPELLLCIKDCLEEPDIVCLSLCSHHLLGVIGKQCLSLADGDNQLKPAILMRVGRDLPHLFYCPYCTKLHRIKDIPHPTLRSKRSVTPVRIWGYHSHAGCIYLRISGRSWAAGFHQCYMLSDTVI